MGFLKEIHNYRYSQGMSNSENIVAVCSIIYNYLKVVDWRVAGDNHRSAASMFINIFIIRYEH